MIKLKKALLVCFIFAYFIILILILLKFTSKDQINKSYLNPINNFLKRYGKFAFVILILISLYRIADIVMGVMANIFYLEKDNSYYLKNGKCYDLYLNGEYFFTTEDLAQDPNDFKDLQIYEKGDFK